MLERELPPPLVCFGLIRNLGQDLFAPPNVKGWDGGLSWITTNNLLARYNDAATLVHGDAAPASAGIMPVNNPNAQMLAERRMRGLRIGGVDAKKIVPENDRTDKDKLITALERRLIQDKLKPKQQQALRDYLDSRESLDDATVLNAIRLVMSTPEYQLT